MEKPYQLVFTSSISKQLILHPSLACVTDIKTENNYFLFLEEVYNLYEKIECMVDLLNN